MRSSCVALRLELGRHAVEGVDQPPQLVGRRDGDVRVEIAARDAPRRARQPADRIGDALGHRQPDAGAEQDEEQRRQVDAAIELVDLALDLALPVGERHGQDRRSRPPARTGAAAIMYGNVADAILADEARQPLQRDRAIDVVGRPGRQQPGREQVALARRDELGAVEDVDVLIDHLADPDHHVVARRREPFGAAAQQRVRLLDDALRDRCGARRLELRRRRSRFGEVGRGSTTASVSTGMIDASTNARNSLR